MNKSTGLQALNDQLSQLTSEGELYERLDGGKLRCFACGHRCLIPEGRQGVCKVRFNQNGRLMVPYGYIAGAQCDPIEKKPFFHALPGTNAMSFGMLGCDLHCAYCQNWLTSQTLRDPNSSGRFERVTPEQFVDMAVRSGARTVTSTYNEPLITTEWAVEIFRLAKQHGLYTSFVSNGNGTPEAIEYLKPWTDFYKVDLKSYQDKNYRELGGTLQAVLETIQQLHASKFWLEIVTLVVPGLNDSKKELRDIAGFIAGVSPTVPWHVTAFHDDYKMQGRGRTQAQTLLTAAEIGKQEGLEFVYIGNVAGQCSEWENTYCPSCQTLLIERSGFIVHQNRISNGRCYSCHAEIPGVWDAV